MIILAHAGIATRTIDKLFLRKSLQRSIGYKCQYCHILTHTFLKAAITRNIPINPSKASAPL